LVIGRRRLPSNQKGEGFQTGEGGAFALPRRPTDPRRETRENGTQEAGSMDAVLTVRFYDGS
jgi:hypothetical protein